MTAVNEQRYIGLDPSSKTGLVILDSNGNVLVDEEITSKHKVNPQRMLDIVDNVKSYIKPTDIVVIEGFAYGAKGSAVDFQYGLGWLLRASLYKSGIRYVEATPSQVKKYCSNKGNAKKEDLVLPIFKKWGYEHPSDNVRDAYIMAQMAYRLHSREGLQIYEADILKAMAKSASGETQKSQSKKVSKKG